MAQESARAFIEAAQKDKTLHKAIHQCVLARNAETLVILGERRGFKFTATEVKWAVVNFWGEAAPESWKNGDNEPPPVDLNQIDFFLHRANQKYLVGKKRVPILRHMGLSTTEYILAAVFLIGFVLLVGYHFYQEYNQYRELRDNGIVTLGQIVGHDRQWYSSRASSGYRYYVRFDYTVDKKDYSHKQKVERSRYDALQDGDPVEILYSPSNPEIAALKGTNSYPVEMLALSILLLILLGFLLGGAILEYWIDVGHSKRGTVVLGEITRYQSGYRKKILEVAFDSPYKDKKITRVVSCDRSSYQRRTAHKGDAIAIFYIDESHWWVL